MHSQTSGVDSPQPVTLSALRDNHRPLLVFAPHTNPQFLKQIRDLAGGASDLHQRDVLVIPILLHDDNNVWRVTFNLGDLGTLSAAERSTARKRFHIAPNAFTVILIGKDGGEKLRSATPVSIEALRITIDAMPMRQDEMRHAPKP